MEGVKLGCRDDLCQFFHIHGLDVNDICCPTSSKEREKQRRRSVSNQNRLDTATEATQQKLTKALVADVEIPKVDSQIVRGNICLLVRIDRNRVYVVCMGVCVDFAGDGGNDVFLVCHSR